MSKYQKLHNEVLKYLESFKGVHEVKDTLETPNKYGDNKSHYSVKYDYEDRWNYTVTDLIIDWDRGSLFVRLKGTFDFKSFADIKSIIKKNTKIK